MRPIREAWWIHRVPAAGVSASLGLTGFDAISLERLGTLLAEPVGWTGTVSSATAAALSVGQAMRFPLSPLQSSSDIPTDRLRIANGVAWRAAGAVVDVARLAAWSSRSAHCLLV